ncbi:hypothetical protein DFH07DRAFT_958746 [Mycena maculata]|uniref:SWIM-type domain-containing protein n=1 Tax=Mycena maculata TaxID=230809 RepID=A0AAD7J7L2_9AGAR|nr:hypothetical protein DFH07DRAFT_958746 [Mycena maculata]
MLFKFKLDAPQAQFSSPSYPSLFNSIPATHFPPSNASECVPLELFSDYLPPENPATPPEPAQEFPFTFNTFGRGVQPLRFTRGSYHSDLASGKYTMKWSSVAEMQQWIRDEEKDKTIELHRKENRKNRSRTAPAWSLKHIYVCSRQGSRSISKYTKKTAWGRKVPSKQIVTGCQCRLTVKTYPGTQEVPGRYTHEHSHPTSDANARFIAHGFFESEFVTAADIRKIEKEIEVETIRLDAQDGQSTKECVENLRKRGELMGFKGSSDASPAGSSLASDTFALCVQTKYQSECWQKWGSRFAGLDATHNTTHYQGMKFSARWDEIKALAPPSVISYLKTNWLSDRDVEMWSAKFRRDRNVFELGDTNMLVESWHHLLKGKFLEGKHRRQDFGFEGPDLEVKRRMEVESRALSIRKDAIENVDSESIYRVQSQSDPSHYYSVDIEAYTCDCLSFPLIDFCKHVCAVQRLFPEMEQEVPVSSLGNVSAAPTSSDSDEDESGDEEDLSQASNTEDPRILDLINSLQHLAVRTRPSYFNDSLMVLKHAVDTVLDETSFADVEVLPARKKLAPNQGSDWRSTQEVMGAPVKSKRKPKHTNPYSGGEQSGRKGQPDARQPLPPPTIPLPPQPTQPIPPPAPSHSTIPFHSMPMAMPPPYNPPHHLPWLDPQLQSSIPLDLNSAGPSVRPQDRNSTNLAVTDPYAQLYYRSYDSPHPDVERRLAYYR